MASTVAPSVMVVPEDVLNLMDVLVPFATATAWLQQGQKAGFACMHGFAKPWLQQGKKAGFMEHWSALSLCGGARHCPELAGT